MTIEKLKEALISTGSLATIVSSLFMLLVKMWIGRVDSGLAEVQRVNIQQENAITKVTEKEEAHYSEVLRWLQILDGKLDVIRDRKK